jgi:hypothetical protein
VTSVIDGYIRADPPGDHFCAAQPYFFLYGIDDIEPVWELLFIFF